MKVIVNRSFTVCGVTYEEGKNVEMPEKIALRFEQKKISPKNRDDKPITRYVSIPSGAKNKMILPNYDN